MPYDIVRIELGSEDFRSRASENLELLILVCLSLYFLQGAKFLFGEATNLDDVKEAFKNVDGRVDAVVSCLASRGGGRRRNRRALLLETKALQRHVYISLDT